MNTLAAHRLARLGLFAFAAAALTSVAALGCSLIVTFDEPPVATDETGADASETAPSEAAAETATETADETAAEAATEASAETSDAAAAEVAAEAASD